MEGPQVSVRTVGCQPDGHDPRRWRVAWAVHNHGTEPLELEAAWIPHGRFRGEGRLPLQGQIDADGSHELAFAVIASEAPGTVVDNAFLILRLNLRSQPWRVFVRMRIEFDADAVPRPVVELVSTQSLK